MSTEAHITQIETVLRTWLADPAITLICGNWAKGSIMELLPEGRATLSGPRYAEPFAGLRDLHLDGQGHHVHLDLARFACAVYTIAPSVCYGFRPSFELHFRRDDDEPGFALALSVRDPWRGAALARDRVVGYFQRVLAHRIQFADVVRFRATAAGRDQATAWSAVHACLRDAAGRTGESGRSPGEGASAEGSEGPDALMAAVHAITTGRERG